jgi:hypothetical protein
MAVTINTYYSERSLEGVRPSNPSTPDGIIPPVVNPPGSGFTTVFTRLGDVNDSDYVGKNGFVPVVTGENGLTLQPIPQIAENGLISGGVVQWTGSGYIFNISSAFYRIGNDPYQTDPTQKTLSAPDATFDRIDVFAVDINNAVVVIEGTPSATPVKPQIDPLTELELTSVIVTAATTEPILTEELIYAENIEWAGTSAGTGTVNFASTNDPYDGTVSVETTDIQNGFFILFNNGSTIDITDYQTLGFQIKLKQALNPGQNLSLVFYDGSANPASNQIQVLLDKNSTDYQFIGVVLSNINFLTNDIQYLRLSFIRTKGTPVYSGYFLDEVRLEGGINPPVTVNSFLSLSDTPQTYVGQGGKTVSVKADESGLEFVTGGGGSSTFLDLTDTPSTYVSQAGLFPRVNVGETALEFDSVSPYDLDQEGASDGQVLTWVSTNSRYEPVTPSGGGSSPWTTATGFIYRDNPVQIGKTTASDGGSTNNVTFLVQSKFDSSQYRMVKYLSLAGDELFYLRDDGISFHSAGIGYGVEGLSNVSSRYRSNDDTGSSASIRAENQSGDVKFQVDGDTAYFGTTCPVGFHKSNPLTNFSITVQSQSSGGGTIAFYTFAGSLQALIDNSMHWRSSGGAYFGRQSNSTLTTNRVVMRGIGTGTTNTLLLEDSAGTDNVAFLDNGRVKFLRLPTSSAGLATGDLWNDSGTIKIV